MGFQTRSHHAGDVGFLGGGGDDGGIGNRREIIPEGRAAALDQVHDGRVAHHGTFTNQPERIAGTIRRVGVPGHHGPQGIAAVTAGDLDHQALAILLGVVPGAAVRTVDDSRHADLGDLAPAEQVGIRAGSRHHRRVRCEHARDAVCQLGVGGQRRPRRRQSIASR